MPLDVRGRTRATMVERARRISSLVRTNPVKRSISSVLGTVAWNSSHERGIPSRRESSSRVDYVPVLCTHRPSLLPIEWFSETVGRGSSRLAAMTSASKDDQTVPFRGSKSRNKVAVGEPAAGSLMITVAKHFYRPVLGCFSRRIFSFVSSELNI